MFRIQVGAFLERENAERLVARLRSEGFDATTSGSEQSPFRMVRVGAYGTREEADRTLAGLVAQGFTGFVVREP